VKDWALQRDKMEGDDKPRNEAGSKSESHNCNLSKGIPSPGEVSILGVSSTRDESSSA